MSGEGGSVTTAVSGALATITFANEAQRGAITPAMLERLLVEVDRLPAAGVRALVLRGPAGQFSSGFAIDRFPDPEDLPPDDGIEALCRAIESAPVPVIARLEGLCIGAGLDLACACDLRYATRGTRLGITPARLGLVYSWRGTARVARAAGVDAARRLLLTGELVEAGTPVGRRLVTDVLDGPEALDAAVAGAAALVLRNAPLSLAGIKRTFVELSDVLALDAEASAGIHRLRHGALGSADCAAAQRAFAAGEAPEFQGR